MKKIFLSFTIILIVSCKPIISTVYVDRYKEVTKVDSIYQYSKDTVTITQRGDTFFVNNYSTKIDYKYKYLTKFDTISQITTEFKTKIEYKEKKVTKWISYFDWIAIGLLFIYALFKGLKFFKLI